LLLIASGRVTPAEGERLLTLWNEGREQVWVLAGCIAICAMELNRHLFLSLERLVRMMPENIPGLHHAFSVLTFLIGGVL
jgi:hypothetical protein